VSDIGRHHRSGRSIRRRNLHERVLHRHCRDTEHIRGDREYCGGGAPRARHDANGEEGNKKEQLQQQQQRPRRRNPSALEAVGEQAGQKEDQYEDRNQDNIAGSRATMWVARTTIAGDVGSE
jgi:hypothetical protein